MPNKEEKADRNGVKADHKVYVTRTGGLYVKAHELLRSGKGRERLAAMTKLASTLQSPAKARKGS